MRRFAKKPKILKLKIEVSNLIKKKCESKDLWKHRWGCYWHGHFKFEDKVIYIYWQNYTTSRVGVDYIHIRYWTNGSSDRAMGKKELERIKSVLQDNI